MSFLPLILLSATKPGDAGLKYFLIQAVASLLILQARFSWTLHISPHFIILMALSLKLGVAPLHFWLPVVAEKISWGVNIILLTIQKIGPLFLLASFRYSTPKIFFILRISAVVVGALGGLNELFLRKLIAYSSISHMGWVLAAILVKTSLWIFYLSIYITISLALIRFLLKFNIFHLRQTILKTRRFTPIPLLFLSLGGFPPFLGFAPKWAVVIDRIFLSIIITFILILSRVVTLFFYLRSGLAILTLSSKSIKIRKPPYFNLIENFLILVNIFGGVFYIFLIGRLTL